MDGRIPGLKSNRREGFYFWLSLGRENNLGVPFVVGVAGSAKALRALLAGV